MVWGSNIEEKHIVRIAIVCFDYAISVGSLTTSLPYILAKAGHSMDIFLDEKSNNYCATKLDSPRVTTHILITFIKKLKFNPLFMLLSKFSERFLGFFSLKIRYQIAMKEKSI